MKKIKVNKDLNKDLDILGIEGTRNIIQIILGLIITIFLIIIVSSIFGMIFSVIPIIMYYLFYKFIKSFNLKYGKYGYEQKIGIEKYPEKIRYKIRKYTNLK